MTQFIYSLFRVRLNTGPRAGEYLNFDLAFPSEAIPSDFFPSDVKTYGYAVSIVAEISQFFLIKKENDTGFRRLESHLSDRLMLAVLGRIKK